MDNSEEEEGDSSDDTDSSMETLDAPAGTCEEFLATAIAFKVRTNQSDGDFFKSLKLTKNFFPTSKKFPKSLYFAKKELKRACNLTPTFVVFCDQCNTIVERSSVGFQTQAHCDVCNVDLNEKLASGSCQFVTLSIRQQIEKYVTNRNFQKVIRKFKRMTASHMTGSLHKGIVEKGHFDLTFCIDAAQLHKKQGRAVTPGLLLFRNLPICLQLRYPVMPCVCVGTKEQMPPRQVFLEEMVKELRQLAEKPIKWTDDLGNSWTSFVYLPCVLTDHLEKQAMMAHRQHSTKFACPFCEIEGVVLKKVNYPNIFKKGNAFRKTKGPETVGGGHRFISKPNASRFKRRGSEERIRIGIQVNELETNPVLKNEKSIRGITGLPALMALPRFHETGSHVSDTLHTVCHGIIKDILKGMMKGHGKRHNFAEDSKRDFSFYDDLMATMTRVKESDRNCSSLSHFNSWTAYDELQFILHNVALFGADDVYMDKNVYLLLLHLANVVYLSHYGRMSETVISQVQDELEEFRKKATTVLQEEYFTIKFHLLMDHWCDFLRLHGSASLTDGFNMERFNLHTIKSISSTRKELGLIVRNFDLKNHSRILHNIKKFGPAGKANLRFLGFTEEYTPSFSDVITKMDKDQRIPEEIKDRVIRIAEENKLLGRDDEISNATQLRRVLRMTRKGVTLECGRLMHRTGSTVNDSFIRVDEGPFGQIEEIVSINSTVTGQVKKFILVVRKFKKTVVLYDTGAVRMYPINQFPCEDSEMSGLAEYYTFPLNLNTFIQKCQISQSSVYQFGQKVQLMSIYPNEWFRL